MRPPCPAARIVGVCCTLALLLVSPAALAGASASDWYEAGMAHMETERFDRAAVAFDQAYELDPSTVLLWNAARAHDKAGQLEAARNRYERFLQSEDAPAKLQKWTTERLAELDATIKAESESQRAAEREKLAKEIRTQIVSELKAELDRRESPPTQGDPGARDWLATDAQLREVGGVEEPSTPVAGWVLLGVGIAATAAGAILLVDASALKDEVENPEREGEIIVGQTQREADDKADRAELEGTIGIWTVGAGAASLIAGAVLLATHEGGGEPERRVDISLTPTGAMFTASGRF